METSATVRIGRDAPARPCWDEAAASTIIGGFSGQDGAMLPILHALQARFGHVPEAAVPMVAQALNLTRAEVHGIVSFYHDFRDAPPGRRVLQICRAEACQAMGGAGVAARLLERLGLGWGETSADGGLTVLPVFCLGLCACAPAVLLDGEPLGRLDDDALAGALS